MGREPYMRRSGRDFQRADGTEVKPYAFRHPCRADGCEREGGWGFKVDLKRNKPGKWYCFEHRHLGEALYASSTHGGQDDGAKESPDEHQAARDVPEPAAR